MNINKDHIGVNTSMTVNDNHDGSLLLMTTSLCKERQRQGERETEKWRKSQLSVPNDCQMTGKAQRLIKQGKKYVDAWSPKWPEARVLGQ